MTSANTSLPRFSNIIIASRHYCNQNSSPAKLRLRQKLRPITRDLKRHSRSVFYIFHQAENPHLSATETSSTRGDNHPLIARPRPITRDLKRHSRSVFYLFPQAEYPHHTALQTPSTRGNNHPLIAPSPPHSAGLEAPLAKRFHPRSPSRRSPSSDPGNTEHPRGKSSPLQQTPSRAFRDLLCPARSGRSLRSATSLKK